jgi:SDR family mycofactocin-dependent oxidoreductase
MGRFEGKVALITGGARGQGRSHAVRLAREGAEIITIDLCEQIETVESPMSTPADLAETVRLVEAEDRRILARQGDVRDLGAMEDLVKATVAEFGHIDIVLANAGILPVTGPHAKARAAWFDAIDIMLTGVYNTVEAVLPPMLERDQGGSIVITSSTAGLNGLARSVAALSAGLLGYGAAKHGVVGLMRFYANALASHSIRVNTVHPTGVNSPMAANEEFARFMQENPEMLSTFENPMPVPMVECGDITNAVLWLASDEARYVTGITLPVDAGLTNK